MFITTVKIKTNCHKDGFYNETLSAFNDAEKYCGHLPSGTAEAFNKIDKLVEGGQHFIDGHYIEIISIIKRDIITL
jgi:hypothetical protein